MYTPSCGSVLCIHIYTYVHAHTPSAIDFFELKRKKKPIKKHRLNWGKSSNVKSNIPIKNKCTNLCVQRKFNNVILQERKKCRSKVYISINVHKTMVQIVLKSNKRMFKSFKRSTWYAHFGMEIYKAKERSTWPCTQRQILEQFNRWKPLAMDRKPICARFTCIKLTLYWIYCVKWKITY